jgi:[acyl-carrier-protein] S-malonyltransferase
VPETAFVFPGQGSQEPGILDPFAETWPTVGRVLDRISPTDALGSLLFEADEATLREPENAQRAVLATGIAVAAALAEQVVLEPDLVAGHSLGHITAATAAGVFSPADAVELVADRGRLMATAEADAGPGTMVAVLLTSRERVEAVVDDVSGVAVAGYNGPGQTVISGPVAAVDEAVDALDRRVDSVRTTELDVGSAFHSPVMAPAVDPFREALRATAFADPDVPVVSDVSGDVYAEGAATRHDLGRQLTSPVRWQAVVETLADRGVDRVVELPPAGTLARFVERIEPELDVVTIDDPADAEAVGRRV